MDNVDYKKCTINKWFVGAKEREYELGRYCFANCKQRCFPNHYSVLTTKQRKAITHNGG